MFSFLFPYSLEMLPMSSWTLYSLFVVPLAVSHLKVKLTVNKRTGRVLLTSLSLRATNDKVSI